MKSITQKCKVKGCLGVGHLDPKQGKRYFSHGLCTMHHTRILKGLPLEYTTRLEKRPATIEGDIAKIPLGVNARQGYAIVDEKDSWVDKFNWCLFKNGYVSRKGEYLHNLILGTPKNGYQVDHKNRDRLDNRRGNLRLATSGQNNSNFPRENKSGYRGVYRSGNGWQVKVSKNYVSHYVGIFTDIKEAALAYNRKAIELHGEFATLNNMEG